jgi:hypothetical protein
MYVSKSQWDGREMQPLHGQSTFWDEVSVWEKRGVLPML